jgi:Ion channel
LQTRFSQHARALTGHRFFLLFVFILATLLLYPYAETTKVGDVGIRILGGGVILISIYAISFRRSVLMLAILLALPALVQRIALPEISGNTQSILRILLSFAFDIFVVVLISRDVFAKLDVNSETIFGALCIYLLIAFSFASLYGLAVAFRPDAFFLDPHVNLHTVPDRFDFIYYSCGTITSLGAAGITPVSAPARALTVVEAIIGVLYLAVLIARLMGAYRGGHNRVSGT